MREPERDFGRLQDIIQAANHIASFTDGYSQEELKDDKLRFSFACAIFWFTVTQQSFRNCYGKLH